jgi:hypothetical protein
LLGRGGSYYLPFLFNPSTSDSAWFDLVFSVGKRIAPFTSLGMPAAGENDSQYFWGSDLAVLLLRTFPCTLRGRHGMTNVYYARSISNKHTGGETLNKLDWQGELQTEFGPGSATGESVEHPRFIMSSTREEIMLKDSEFMATRCSKSSCRFSMENPRV